MLGETRLIGGTNFNFRTCLRGEQAQYCCVIWFQPCELHLLSLLPIQDLHAANIYAPNIALQTTTLLSVGIFLLRS